MLWSIKRVSELIIERFSNNNKVADENPDQIKTAFDSSFWKCSQFLRSVIPLFQNQIAKGGPIYHYPEITRYLTIPEAIELVLQSSSISKGGEIFYSIWVNL